MSYPILEHDPDREAFIEPSRVIPPRDIPHHCVICFFRDVIEKIVQERETRVAAQNRWEDGPHPVYEIEHRGERLAFYHPGIGSLSASLLEEAIAFGCRKFIACGGCGVLDAEIAAGHLIALSGAIRDEGASYHYLPPGREVTAHEGVLHVIESTLLDRDIPYRKGKTWTTDAPYRETPGKIARRKQEGCLVVEMEAAGMMAVAQFRDVLFGQIVYGGDNLGGEKWDNRGWQSLADIRESLFWLCADICITL